VIRSRLQKLEGNKKPDQPIIVLMPGEEPTADQLQEISQARAAGIRPYALKVVKASEEKAKQGSGDKYAH
jgi:hypothetical protein